MPRKYSRRRRSSKKRTKTNKKSKKMRGGVELCICLDDVAWDRSFFTSKTFSQLCFNGRHMHITARSKGACADRPEKRFYGDGKDDPK